MVTSVARRVHHEITQRRQRCCSHTTRLLVVVAAFRWFGGISWRDGFFALFAYFRFGVAVLFVSEKGARGVFAIFERGSFDEIKGSASGDVDRELYLRFSLELSRRGSRKEDFSGPAGKAGRKGGG